MSGRLTQHLLEEVVTRIPMGLSVTDPNGTMLWSNAMWSEVMAGDGDSDTAWDGEASGQNMASRTQLMRALASDGDSKAEVSVALPSGRNLVVRLRQADIHDEVGQRIARIAMLDDVTESSLARAHQRTVMEIASHDLRNPLSVILVNAVILSRGDPLPEDRRIKAAGRIVANTLLMNRMIEDLFDYTALMTESHIPVRMREGDLAVVASKALGEMRTMHPGRDLLLRSHGDLRGCWDVDRMQRALQNLLGNLMKYGDPATGILVECAELADPPGVGLAIESSGRPRDGDHIVRLFEASKKGLASCVRDSQWLSLCVVQEIVQAHSGSITLTTVSGEGLRFSITLPKRNGAEVIG